MIGLKRKPRRYVAGENTFVERVAETQKMRHDYVRGERARRHAMIEAEYRGIVAEQARYQFDPTNNFHPPVATIAMYLRLLDRSWQQFYVDVRLAMFQEQT